jgi:outer membrane protein OmpA-like peptidoglycan-associated protein
MRYELGIEVNHTKYLRFLSLTEQGRGKCFLTTIRHHQREAVLKIFMFSGQKKRQLEEITIRIPKGEMGDDPWLDLVGDFDGRRNVHMKVLLNNEIYREIDILLPIRLSPWLLAIPAALAIGALLWLLGSFLFSTFSATPKSSLKPRDSSAREAEKPEISTQPGLETEEPPPPPPTPAFTARDVTVYFDPNSPILTSREEKTLRELLPLLKEHPTASVSIFGHCASFGSEKGRQELSSERAAAVENFLRAGGWSPTESPEITGYGANRPVTTDPDRQQVNRRVEIRIEPPE